MLKTYAILFLLVITRLAASAQTNPDTAKHLQAVTVKGYLSNQSLLSVPASVGTLNANQLKLQPDNSLVSSMNTVPGVRMEERSPGSYRLSIRGSLLRSPFGVRDVKIYYDDIPLTDAGGNSYLNTIDFNTVYGIEILKGPDGSLFGANSGGVMLINPVAKMADGNFIKLSYTGGSYALNHEAAAIQNVSGNNQLDINQAFESYGGYRQHSNMYRHFFQVADRVAFSEKDNLRLLGFYSDLKYQTPGGLTLAQFNTDPSLARLPAGPIAGAIQNNIGITTKMLMGGAVNEWKISPHVRNVFSVYGTYVDFTNPFITNYENRYEYTYGLRTYFEFTGEKRKSYAWVANAGIEWQQTNSDINNYGIKAGGIRDTAQTLDKVNSNQHFIFVRYQADIAQRLHVEAALSLNFYSYNFLNVYPQAQTSYTPRNFTPQLMPRVALSYQITNDFIWRASVSRGYSTPTTAEIRPTDNVINTALQAEYGLNYETGFRLRNRDESMYLDASVFYYDLHDAIVLRLHPDETQYYVNAGGTHQPGFELYFSNWIVKQHNSGFIRGVQINESYTLSKFSFVNYQVNAANYSGNEVTGVPRQVIVSSLQFRFPKGIYLFAEYNHTDKIPLTDGNAAYAAAYNIVQAKAGWETRYGTKSKLNIFAGADNILNEKYSLGNDLNAVGNRFYNAAAPRNFYAGFSLLF